MIFLWLSTPSISHFERGRNNPPPLPTTLRNIKAGLSAIVFCATPLSLFVISMLENLRPILGIGFADLKLGNYQEDK